MLAMRVSASWATILLAIALTTTTYAATLPHFQISPHFKEQVRQLNLDSGVPGHQRASASDAQRHQVWRAKRRLSSSAGRPDPHLVRPFRVYNGGR
jgi:hypothetical protein